MTDAPLLDAPNTTIAFLEDRDRPLQAVPKGRLRACAKQGGGRSPGRAP